MRYNRFVFHVCLGFVLIYVLASAVSSAEFNPFHSAQPIWPKDRQTEKNLMVGFNASFMVSPEESDTDTMTVRLAASTLYRLFVNGEFAGYGPARGPHGYYRVDEWEISQYVVPGQNWMAVEVAGYNVNSYYLLDQPAFLQAEIQNEGRVIASTAGQDTPFEAHVLTNRIQKVQRYSFQRPFIEVYRLAAGYDKWRMGKQTSNAVECEVVEKKPLLPRRVAYPRFDRHAPVRLVSEGEIQTGVEPKKLWKDRSLVNIGPKLKGYPESELDIVVSNELQTIATKTSRDIKSPYQWDKTVSLQKNQYAIFDFGTNNTGFIGGHIRCTQPTRLYLTFDEILSDGDVDWKRLGCVNAVLYELEKGEYEFESFEPYTFRYLKAMVLDGNCEIESLYLRDYVNPGTNTAMFSCSDPRLNLLFEAGKHTYDQNAVDIFMDCPSRERAGWLCDSFFTARVAFDLSRNSKIETNFYENYLLPDRFEHLPDGMLPMCYPADHNDGVFIPNWAMWFVVQLEEYYQRTGDREMIDALKPKVLQLLDYFEPFINEDGLLEHLDSWVFVEWSAANQFVQDVNYPTNMLYSRVLDVVGRLYDMEEMTERANRIRETIQKQSFDGQFFVDNAVREDGKLKVTRNRSEVCQYFAFFFDIANPQTHPELWKILQIDFGPHRKETKAYSEVHVANSFIGNVLRLELLSRYGRCQQILDESIAYLMYMADRTGTLWENDGAYASCNHGFASHIVHVLDRDVLGVYQIDPIPKTIRLRFSDLNLDWCEGRIPLKDGDLSLRWQKDGGKINYCVTAPAGYSIQVDSLGDTVCERVY